VIAAVLALGLVPPLAAPEALPRRVERSVLHTLGGPFYDDPARRFVFYTPRETLALWGRSRLGAHWIVWTDGSLWPRQPAAGEPESRQPLRERAADAEWRRRLAREAAPVWAHAAGANADSLGIEVAHSGRSDDTFPEAQLQALAWLLRTLLDMSGGRLGPASVLGHKDVDRRKAYVSDACQRRGCAYFVDAGGDAYRRRVDPPEGLFAALARHGVVVPRANGEGDGHLLRAERTLGDRVPAVAR
jgi:hypothetical protein